MQYTIWIEAEEWAEGQWNIDDGNTDVMVIFEDDSRWVASFYTYKNIHTLVEKNRSTRELLAGRYFWGSDMILIDQCSRQSMEQVIKDLISEGQFENVFKECK
ncbi:hypothetical protein D3C73_615640 [compost metagenome]